MRSSFGKSLSYAKVIVVLSSFPNATFKPFHWLIPCILLQSLLAMPTMKEKEVLLFSNTFLLTGILIALNDVHR